MKRSPASTASLPSNTSWSRCRAPAKVMLAQLVSSWRWTVARPSAKASSASRRRERGSWRSRTGRRMGSVCMRYLLMGVHEMFRSRLDSRARYPPPAQVEDEAGIVRHLPPELGRGHFRPAKEHLDLAQQHGNLLALG